MLRHLRAYHQILCFLLVLGYLHCAFQKTVSEMLHSISHSMFEIYANYEHHKYHERGLSHEHIYLDMIYSDGEDMPENRRANHQENTPDKIEIMHSTHPNAHSMDLQRHSNFQYLRADQTIFIDIISPPPKQTIRLS